MSACSFDLVPCTSLFPFLFVLFIFANPCFKEGKKFTFLYHPPWQWCHRANIRFKGAQGYHNKSTHSKKHNSKPAEKLLSCITRGDADCFLFVCFFIMDKCVTWSIPQKHIPLQGASNQNFQCHDLLIFSQRHYCRRVQTFFWSTYPEQRYCGGRW